MALQLPTDFTAEATSALADLPPPSAETIAAAVSSAIEPTSCMAASLILATARLGVGKLRLEARLDRLARQSRLPALPSSRAFWPMTLALARASGQFAARRQRPRASASPFILFACSMS